ncbi:MAG: hypothetical protein KAY22_25395 [Rhizorhabdus sp.]|uniref:hypothetical protein n=1 Tax=Rhizorhabdus sp. TaxID=1968843 RepID=UPI001B6E0A4C|nr:hypothetical protein [Rhizorhabdus sp.]MBP8235633.1 hypothetical protein [Rhizorhabdus sp.]
MTEPVETELVKRLRSATPPHYGKCLQAADEIERLQAELARVSKVGAQMAYTLGCIANEDWHGMTADDARREARAALEEWG